jgi:cytochrome b561
MLGWGIAALFIANAVVSSWMPRTAKTLPLREDLRDIHMWLGLALLLLVSARLYFWFKEGRPAPPLGMPRAAHAFSRLLGFSIYLMLLITAVLGIGYAWGNGYQPPLLPMAFKDNYYLWKFTGYFHSAVSFTFLLFNLIGVAFATYAVFHYRVGWLKALPEPLIVQCFGGLLSTAYTLINTGFSKQPGLEILAIIGLIVWALSIWRRGGWRASTRQGAH